MQYCNVKCWACGKVNPYPQDANFFLCSNECREIYEAKASAAETPYKMNRAERRAAARKAK